MNSASPVLSCSFSMGEPLDAGGSTSVMRPETIGEASELGHQDESITAIDSRFRYSFPSHPDGHTTDRYRCKNHLLRSAEMTSSPVDTYHDDGCDVGPRPFVETLRCVTSTPQDILQFVICYNQALMHHEKEEYASAMQLYSVVAGAVNMSPTDNLPATEKQAIAVKAYNNMGYIVYTEHSAENSLSLFEGAIFLARSLQDLSSDHRLAYATTLSNWCRVQWMTGKLSQGFYSALEEVLSIRFSILGWDHVDVASAHYNLGMAEYCRQDKDAALHHFEQYLAVYSHEIKAGKAPKLDPILGLTFVLLINNEHKEDKPSQDLAWGLRTLQEKRNELGRNHHEIASILNFVGTLLFHFRELDHALLFFQEELRIEEDLIKKGEDISVSVTCNNIGRILQELGQFKEAIVYYQQSLSVKVHDNDPIKNRTNCEASDDVSSSSSSHDRKLSPATMNLYSTVWYNLGLIHDKLGSFVDAIQAFQMSLQLRRAMLGHNHTDVACLLYNIGVLQMEQQMLSEATKSFVEALRIRRVTAPGQLSDGHVVKTLQKLSSLHKAKGDLSGALEACEGIIRLLEVSRDFDEISRLKNMGSTLRDIAELHHAQGSVELALQIALDGARILRLLRQMETIDKDEYPVAVEEETTILLLIGSLQHETCNPMAAYTTFAEAASLIYGGLISHKPSEDARQPALLLPLFEISSVLASAHCAPRA